jgi:nucleoside 2-deoxyribosyltransferase
MPIQGDEYGAQTDRNIFLEYTARFAVVEKALEAFDCIAIRIDREAPMGSLVERIKREIARSQFVIADLTDERPSCYFEAGYADALGKPLIFVASRESVLHPGEATKIHFDIHQNVQFFGNHKELAEKISDVVTKNRTTLLAPPTSPGDFTQMLRSFTVATAPAGVTSVIVPYNQ